MRPTQSGSRSHLVEISQFCCYRCGVRQSTCIPDYGGGRSVAGEGKGSGNGKAVGVFGNESKKNCGTSTSVCSLQGQEVQKKREVRSRGNKVNKASPKRKKDALV